MLILSVCRRSASPNELQLSRLLGTPPKELHPTCRLRRHTRLLSEIMETVVTTSSASFASGRINPPIGPLASWERRSIAGSEAIDTVADVATIDSAPAALRCKLMATAIASLLASKPVARLSEAENSITVLPNGAGFPICITEAGFANPMIDFGNWHDDDIPASAILRLVRIALHGDVRVTDVLLNGKPWKSDVELRDRSGAWQLVGGMSYVRLGLFRRQIKTRTLQYPKAL